MQAVAVAQHGLVQVASVVLQQGLSHTAAPAQHGFVQAVAPAQHGLVQVATPVLEGGNSQTPFSQVFDSQQAPPVVHEQVLVFESHLHSPPVQGQSSSWHLSPQQAQEAAVVASLA